MNTAHLVKMTNEIAAFFAVESGPQRAPVEVAAHLKKFWEPRMRREIMVHHQQGGAGLSDIARDAIRLLEKE